MEPLIDIFVKGIPYAQNKVHGNIDAPKLWSKAIIDQTSNISKINVSCHLEVIFYLPPNKFPKDFPYGSDVDNLLKRLQDALNQTILSELPNGDSAIIKITASKVKTLHEYEAGAKIMVYPFELKQIERQR